MEYVSAFVICKIIGSQNHRLLCAVRDMRRPPAQHPAQSRSSCEIRPGCSGFHPVGSGKPLGMETGQPLWAAHPTVSVSSWGKNMSLYSI